VIYNGKDFINNTVKANICIVGSGIGGSSLAYELSKNDVDFILIEAGGLEKHLDNVKHENVGLDFKMPTTRSIELGGTSNLWGGGLTLLDEIDFKERKYIPESGWEVSLKELISYYEKAGKIFNLKNFDYFYEEKLSKKFKKEIKDVKYSNNLKNKFFQIPLPIFNFKNILIDIFKENNNQHCYYNSTALELIKSNGKIKKIKVGTDGGFFEIKANIFILATGALETPRLLLNSNIKNQNIGKYLMDHPKGYLSQLDMKESGIPKHHIYAFMKYDGDDMQIKTGLTIKNDVQLQNEIFNHNVYIKPIVNNLNIMRKIEELGIIVHTFRNSENKLKDILFLLRNFNTLLRGVAYKFDFSALYKKTGIFIVSEQIPSPNSNVDLSSIKDKWGYPIAKINWQVAKQDIDNVKKFYSFLKENLNYPKEDFKYGLNDDADDWKNTLSSAAHHCGTCRIGKNEKDGVIDKNLKVYGFENLFICDASIFRTSGNANPAFTISAFAVRLIEHILSRGIK